MSDAFTLQGHPLFAAAPGGALEARPPKKFIPGSNANYWQLDEALIANMQCTLTPLDPTVPVFKDGHACVTGVVGKVIHEQDGDIHLWLELDDRGKARLACEITPQQKIPAPPVGSRVTVYGIWRYDFQHAWWEIHPVDYIEAAK